MGDPSIVNNVLIAYIWCYLI